MSQLAASEGQPGKWEEPDESRDSCPVLLGPWGEIPLDYSTHRLSKKCDTVKMIYVGLKPLFSWYLQNISTRDNSTHSDHPIIYNILLFMGHKAIFLR